MDTGLIHEGERLDDLQISGRYILQDPKRFCFGMDAVLLSGFVSVKPGETVIDLGTGTGILPILLEAKTKGEHFTGLEIQSESADMAQRSVSLNGRNDRISIVCGDIREASGIFGKASFNVVVSNPPYMIADHGIANPSDAKAIARHEICCKLEDLIRETKALLRPDGRCYFVHRPFRLVELLSDMHIAGIEPKRLRMVHPYKDKEPSMVLVEGKKGGRPRLSVEPPLIIYEKDGVYTKEVDEIYGF
ncbi:MAG: tRNA1(Val) (adenine(37)-N6)-methyltransferase [Lachnospiraceae bacterium]|nr:tRNA1(Val) (adenine(37)-N6)-methyltransferase [Lachnospiraceae bacterium]